MDIVVLLCRIFFRRLAVCVAEYEFVACNDYLNFFAFGSDGGVPGKDQYL